MHPHVRSSERPPRQEVLPQPPVKGSTPGIVALQQTLEAPIAVRQEPDAVGVPEVGGHYELARPEKLSNPEEFEAILARHGLTTDMPVRMLAYGRNRKVGQEARPLYFGALISPDGTLTSQARVPQTNASELPLNRIISFGECNVACPYCKRGMQFIDQEGNPIVVVNVPLQGIGEIGEGAIQRNETVRFSGGDPIMYQRQVLALAEYYHSVHGKKSSVAHNGSGPEWMRRLAPFLESAAIDLKATPEKIGEIMGLDERIQQQAGPRLYQRSLETQRILTESGVLVDVRTPVFGDTTLEEMLRLAHDIANNDLERTFWTWRMYKQVQGCDFVVPDDPDKILEMMTKVSAQYPQIWMGMRAKWHQGGMVFVKEGRIIQETSDTADFEPEIGLEKVS